MTATLTTRPRPAVPWRLPGAPLVSGTLLARRQRFLADVLLDGGARVVAHCPNSGSMRTCSEPGRPVLLSHEPAPHRKLAYTWQAIRMGRSWVGVHSAASNHLVAHLLRTRRLPELDGYTHLRREQRYGDGGRSRVDLLLAGDGRPDCYVEVKHGTMRAGVQAAFPDAPTERGRKHLEDLMQVVREGRRGVLLFVVARGDCRRFRPADEIDAAYGRLLREAVARGVEVLAYGFSVRPPAVRLTGRLPVDL